MPDTCGRASIPSAQGSAFDCPLSAPLVLDLDGTLIAGDMLRTSFFSATRERWLVALLCVKWLARGRAVLKRELAVRCHIDQQRLKMHEDVVALALREKAAGRSVVLATAADALLAEQLAMQLNFIDRVIASDGECNLKGRAKAQILAKLFPGGFIYAGDSKADLFVWKEASAIVLVNAPKSVAKQARALAKSTLELSGRAGPWRAA